MKDRLTYIFIVLCMLLFFIFTINKMKEYYDSRASMVTVDTFIPEVFSYNKSERILTFNIQNLSKDEVTIRIKIKPYISEEVYDIKPDTTLGDIKTELLNAVLPQTIKCTISYITESNGKVIKEEERTATIKEF